MSWHSLYGGTNRSRSVSPYNNRNYRSNGPRTRSQTPSRRPLRISRSVDFEHRGRSQTPQRRSNLRSSTTRLCDCDNYYDKDDGKLSFFFLF
jgi:hypothetical protein